MKTVLTGKTESGASYKVFKRADGRFAVKLRGGSYLNGAEKTKILVGGGLVKAPMPKKQEEAAPEAQGE